MLEELSLRNYALIDGFALSFQNGFNILTGETGAGKSIIVGSLSFLLGAKADAAVIRTGADEASVSAVVSVDEKNRDALSWLKDRDITLEDDRLIIRRNIKLSGRGAIYIQNIPVTRGDLTEFMSLLFDLHGQHSHESLLKKEMHRKYLDRFADLEEETAEFNRIFLDLGDKKKALAVSVSSARERDARLEFLNYAAEEIAGVAPKSGETRELEHEAQKLEDFEKLAAHVNGAAASLFDDEVSILSLSRKARSFLENASAIDGKLSPIYTRMESLYYETEDLIEEFRAYLDDLKYDPERLEAVEERLAVLYRLKKKYGVDEDAVLAYRVKAEAEIETLSGTEEHREKLKAEIEVIERNLAAKAQDLSAKRALAARKLESRITEILSRLGIPQVRFAVAVVSREPGAKACYGPWGADEVEFLISANSGEPLKELSRIASGGELSRVMLAIKTVLSDVDTPETLIFDEIDTGIGGEVALSVGEYLAKIGELKQIFCVTHLASIAVRADNHLKVEKTSQAGRTVTGISVLQGDERRREIARMLSGDAGAAALAHADALLAKYGRHYPREAGCCL
ncbi:MAG: DNA repair protein RecN [Treponema sp.]|jgi:DNA repair protein RecN (Recombination protein N)|nr:DNA repair protein RecN [Treponema sp.]